MAITNFIPEVWVAALDQAYTAAQVITPTVNREYEGQVVSGTTVKVTSANTPSIKDYKTGESLGGDPETFESRTIDPEGLTTTQAELVINQEKAFSFMVDDIDRVQVAGSLEPVTQAAGVALSQDAEEHIIGLMLAGGTNANPGASGTAVEVDSPAKAYDAFVTLRTKLNKANVPFSERFAVVNPEMAALLLGNDSKLTDVSKSASTQELRNGVLGGLLGFTVLESNLLGTAEPTVMGYHRKGLAYASQIQKPEALRAQRTFADILRGLHVYGAKVFKATSIQVYKSVA